MQLKSSEAILAVSDVVQSIAYYREVLGFQTQWTWGHPVDFGGVGRDGISVMFHRQPGLAAKIAGHEHYFRVDDARSFYELHRTNGAVIVGDIENKPWGHLEYTVRDLNGYHLRFGGPIEYVRPATALDSLPDHYRIDELAPSESTYDALKQSVNWSPGSFEHFGSPWGWSVAIDTRTGQTVGCARAMHDGENWYSIWDVIVHPDHQHQRVGTAMIENLVARIKSKARAGIIHLFTYKPGFYATMGFKTETVELLRF